MALSCIWFAVFAAFNWLLCRLLNGPPIKQVYTGLPPAGSKSDPTEKWFFINGIATG